jgi:hypothetical protein
MTPDQSQLEVKAIGVIHSPFKEAPDTPIQPVYAADTQFEVEIFPEYLDGLRDLAGFERVWLVYWFDRAPATCLVVVPFRDSTDRWSCSSSGSSSTCVSGLSFSKVVGGQLFPGVSLVGTIIQE